MTSLMQTKLKAENDARLTEEKKVTERNKNLIVLIERHLLNLGYVEAVNKLQQESTIGLDRWDTADNIDLYIILSEYEQFYELKFNRAPKLVRKLGANDTRTSLPRLGSGDKKGASQKHIEPNPITKEESGKATTPGLPTKNPAKKSTSVGGKPPTSNEAQKNDLNDFEITGNGLSAQAKAEKKAEEVEDFFDNRVLRGLPDYGNNPELRELAMTLQRDICIENPNVSFTDIVGLDQAKRLLKEAVMLPLKYPQLFTGILEPWKGVLLFGPPGTGKTLLAKAVATECKTTFFNISASSIVSKWRGDSEKLVRVLFDLARHYQPSTIFLDELDSIMSQRGGVETEHEGSRRMKTELLIQMDGLIKKRERVFLLAASNMPWDLDAAMLRRLEKRILVPLPDEKARENMLRRFLPPEMAENLKYEQCSLNTEGYSGSDIKLVCKETAMKPVRRLLDQLENMNSISEAPPKKGVVNKIVQPTEVKPGPVTETDFNDALKTTKPSPAMHLDKYKKWEFDYGSQ